KYDGRLPFLFKVLAAAKPLSIQAHPNLIQAEQGFEKENKLKIPLDAYNRNYKDNNHKPECICALTSFYALNGFRKISIILELMEKICPDPLREKLNNLKNQPDSMGLKIFFSGLLTLTHDQQQKIISSAVNKAQRFAASQDNDNAYKWMIKLHKNYPDDIGIFSPIILNLIRLEPGQAMFLPAGQLHSYLEGTGIELMANSDNVLRGGLTPKYIDVPELLSVLNFEEKEIKILLPEKIKDFEKIYQTPAKEFALSIIAITGNDIYISPDSRNVEILLCIEGNAIITNPHENYLIPISSGSSVIIPAIVKGYTINGNARIYKASIPDD
ncbi:MAG: mannose-6-phosphate isomerase, class I, partial [Deltaproteobacteria bacterium]